jgi:uncharacterized RDD family membrane protein YckC
MFTGDALMRGPHPFLDRLFGNAIPLPAIFHLTEADRANFQFACWWAFAFLVAFVVTQARYGVTPGKLLCGLRVVRTTLRPCGMARALLRDLLLLIDTAFLLNLVPGITSILTTGCRQRLGDLAADTIVVRSCYLPRDIADTSRNCLE